MFTLKGGKYLAPAIGKRVLRLRNSGDQAPQVTIENLGTVASAAVRFQESDDGSNWTDIAATVATINPGESKGLEVVSSRALLGLFASGNTDLLVTIKWQLNGSPEDLGSA